MANKKNAKLVSIAPKIDPEKIRELGNEELIKSLVITAYELEIATGDLQNKDGDPIKDQYEDADIEALKSQVESLRNEQIARMTGEAEMQKLVMMADEVQKIRKIYDKFEQSGINMEVLVYYVYHKTDLKISDIRSLFGGLTAFFEEAFKE